MPCHSPRVRVCTGVRRCPCTAECVPRPGFAGERVWTLWLLLEKLACAGPSAHASQARSGWFVHECGWTWGGLEAGLTRSLMLFKADHPQASCDPAGRSQPLGDAENRGAKAAITPKPGASQWLTPPNWAADSKGPALNHCPSLSTSGQGRAWPWGQNSGFAQKWDLGESPGESPGTQRPWGQWLCPPQSSGEHSPAPPSLTWAPALTSSHSRKPKHPFPPLRGATSESTTDTPYPWQAPGWSPALVWGCTPSHPQLPITCWQRGEDQLLSDSHGPTAGGKAPSRLTSSPSPSGARRPSGERSRAPHTRARSPPLALAHRLPWFPAS